MTFFSLVTFKKLLEGLTSSGSEGKPVPPAAASVAGFGRLSSVTLINYTGVDSIENLVSTYPKFQICHMCHAAFKIIEIFF